MTSGFEYRVLHNAAYGAELLAGAIAAWRQVEQTAQGLPLAATYLVLPICWHGPSVASLKGRQSAGLLLRVLFGEVESPDGGKFSGVRAFVGLPARIERHAEDTRSALRLCFAAQALRLVVDGPAYLVDCGTQKVPGRTHDPVADTARRVGRMFAQHSFAEVCHLLHLEV